MALFNAEQALEMFKRVNKACGPEANRPFSEHYYYADQIANIYEISDTERCLALALKMCFMAIAEADGTISASSVSEYIAEAEHQDGIGYWRAFMDPSEAIADMKLYYAY